MKSSNFFIFCCTTYFNNSSYGRQTIIWTDWVCLWINKEAYYPKNKCINNWKIYWNYTVKGKIRILILLFIAIYKIESSLKVVHWFSSWYHLEGNASAKTFSFEFSPAPVSRACNVHLLYMLFSKGARVDLKGSCFPWNHKSCSKESLHSLTIYSLQLENEFLISKYFSPSNFNNPRRTIKFCISFGKLK